MNPDVGTIADPVGVGTSVLGAEIMGRNKFTPERDPWLDENWKGWWGDNPPFHSIFCSNSSQTRTLRNGRRKCFLLHRRYTSRSARRSKKAAGDLDVRIGGGANTLNQFIAANLIDYMHIAMAPVFLGKGESLFESLEGIEKNYSIKSTSSPSGVVHFEFERK